MQQSRRGRRRGVHALFVHVPPFKVLPEQAQFDFLLALLDQLARLMVDRKPQTAEEAAAEQPSAWQDWLEWGGCRVQ